MIEQHNPIVGTGRRELPEIHADAKQPLTGDRKFHRDAGRHVLFADDDPTPDLPQRFLRRRFKLIRHPRRYRGMRRHWPGRRG